MTSPGKVSIDVSLSSSLDSERVEDRCSAKAGESYAEPSRA